MKSGPRGHSIEQYRQLAAEGLTQTQAAARMGVTAAAVCQVAKRYGIMFAQPKRGPKVGSRWTQTPQPAVAPDDIPAIAAMLDDIATLPEDQRARYRELRVEFGVPHRRAMEVLA